ncbi:leucine-rich_repeat domain-containing protein [Hexamita inflata]|uniref:Leucine-rich repeat domain-containing protein n=1 Tax=Hexamita inflata TaxID=28002 RepID=A0AA86PZ65_9EUKA|nr:leucine-rich repeat domain-containing protein [Hexamita inflata]
MTECFIVKDPTDLQNEELKQFVNVRIMDIYFKKLDDVPVHVQILTINNCKLQGIKNLFHLKDLKYFDVKHNIISDISGIVTHLQLEYFDFSFNNVIIIDIKNLEKLKTIISENNYIVNQEPLVQHVNFIVQWLQQQYVPEQKDFRKCLTPGTSEEKVNELMNTENVKKERSQYLENMIKTLAPLIKGNELIAKDLLGITHFGFVDCFDIDTLCLDHCPNINFKELPKKIKHLSITNSGLYRIDGLEKMKQLESIDLTHNKLISCKLLSELPNLTKVNIMGNKIQDLEHITKIPKFQWNFILPQRLVYLQLWEVELLFLVYYVSNYILKYFATSNADDKFQQIISSWRLFMNYSLTQEGQKYDFDRIRPQSTIQSRYLIFQKGKIEITTCNKRTAMTKINAVEDVQGRSTNSLNKLRQF